MGSPNNKPFEVAKREPESFRFEYKTEDQIREDIAWVPLVKMPGCEIGVTSGNTNRAVSLRDEFTRKAQSKKKYEAGDAPTGAQRLKINNQLVARECLHGVRVIANHSALIELPEIGKYENTARCHEKMMALFPDFRAEVNQAVSDATEAAGEAEGESAKN